MKYQLMIIGGGASGLAAAVTAAEYGLKRILILEQLPKTGKKLLSTGNGRCNLSHTGISGKDYRGSLRPDRILSRFGEAPDFFEKLGLFCRTDTEGRLYPGSMAAASVLDAFRLRLAQDNTEILCDQKVTALERNGSLWTVRTEAAVFQAVCVIFAAGGHAAPKLGTDGSAWQMLERLGIQMVQPEPILCPVLSDAKLLYSLKGIRLKGSVTLFDKRKPVCTESGEIQFTEKALSGICLFDLSGLIDSRRIRDYTLSVNCFPGEKHLLQQLTVCQKSRSQASCEDMLTGLVQKPVGRAVLKSCGIAADTPCLTLTEQQLRDIAERLQDLRFPVKGLGDFTQAQATRGGVHGSALDGDLQVKAQPGLYVTGEAVDVQSKCGGYHLHWCWASGAAAAQAAARRIRKGTGA